jgi:protocatechuate 3,4-dioxygenase beta subunit
MPQRLTILCAFYLIGSSALLGQQSSATNTAKSTSTNNCSIAGSVLKATTGEPIKRAGIYLQKNDDPGSGYSAHTDATGHFAIDEIEPGRYNLRVEHTGYVSQSYGENSAASRGAVLTLTPGRKMQDLLFRLSPWAVISGRISDENGDPVPNASVQAMQYVVYQGKRTLQGVHQAQTNDLGEFRVFGLKKGRYFVSARTPEEREPSLATSSGNDVASSENTGYAPVYYPGTPDVARASLVEVMTGQEVPGIDFTLIPVRTFRVRGHVFDATIGQPVKDCFVILMHKDPNRSSFSGERASTGCDKGAFEFRSVPPGPYNLFAMTFGSGKQRSARASLEVENANVTDVAVTFVRGPDLTGRILVEGREAVDFSEIHVWLSDPEQYFNGGVHAVAKSDGNVTLENVPEGNYDVDVGGLPSSYSADFYTKDVRVNGESVLNKGLAIAAGSTRGSLEIVLSSEGTRIDGTVTDESDLPAAGAVIALVPEQEVQRKQFRLYKNATTDQYGKFILRGIAPGKYKLFSWKDVEDNAWQDPDFLKPFEDQGTEITAEKNGHLSIQLKFISADKVKQSQ